MAGARPLLLSGLQEPRAPWSVALYMGAEAANLSEAKEGSVCIVLKGAMMPVRTTGPGLKLSLLRHKRQCIHFRDEETGTQRGKIMCPKSQLLLQLKIVNQDSGFPAQGSYFFAIDLLVSRKICVRAPRKLCHNYHSYHSVLVRLWIDPVMGWGFGGTQDGVNIFCTWDRHEFFRPKADCGRMNNGRSKMFISQFPEPVNMLPYMAEQCCKCN